MDAGAGQPIRGINTWLLELAAIERRFRSRYWATKSRWEEISGVVVRGVGTPIIADEPAEAVLYNVEQVKVRRGAPATALDRF